MKSIFLAWRLETAGPHAVSKPRKKRREPAGSNIPLQLLRMHTRSHSVPSIVDASSYSVATVAFYGRATVGQSRE